MNGFKPMKEKEIRRLLKNQVDVLAPLVKQEEAFLRSRPCPECKKFGATPFVDPKRPFVPGEPLTKKLLRCHCGTEYDPITGIILKRAEG